MGRRAIALGISALAVAVGFFSLDVAQDDPGHWFAGGVDGRGRGVPRGRVGAHRLRARVLGALAREPLRAASRGCGFAWFLLEWNNPGIGSALAFTVGLCLYAACPPLVGHAVLAYPERPTRLRARAQRRLRSHTSEACSSSASCPRSFFDPQAQGCAQCPSNLLAVSDHAGCGPISIGSGLYLGPSGRSPSPLSRSGDSCECRPGARRPRRRSRLPGAGRGAGSPSSLDRGVLSNGTLERRLWLAQAARSSSSPPGSRGAGFGAVALGRRSPSSSSSSPSRPHPAACGDVLAGTVGDPDLVLAYPLDATEPTGRCAGPPGRAGGGPAADEAHPRRARRWRCSATHLGSSLTSSWSTTSTAAARLALENERLQADVRARLEELRASRARIVDAGDAERKRLERDLHDGAQQRLVGLSLSLRLARCETGARCEWGGRRAPRRGRRRAARSDRRASRARSRDLPRRARRRRSRRRSRGARRGWTRSDACPGSASKDASRLRSRQRRTRSSQRRRARPRRCGRRDETLPRCAPRRCRDARRPRPRRRRPPRSPRRPRRQPRGRAPRDGSVTLHAELPCGS